MTIVSTSAQSGRWTLGSQNWLAQFTTRADSEIHILTCSATAGETGQRTRHQGQPRLEKHSQECQTFTILVHIGCVTCKQSRKGQQSAAATHRKRQNSTMTENNQGSDIPWRRSNHMGSRRGKRSGLFLNIWKEYGKVRSIGLHRICYKIPTAYHLKRIRRALGQLN